MFNFNRFVENLSKNKFVASVKYISENVIQIIYVDGQYLLIDIKGDELHKFYTYLPQNNITVYYFGKMPHDSYVDLYNELNRMNNLSSRIKPCKNPYFKSDDLVM